MKKKANPKPTADDICELTGAPYAHTHEVFFGNPDAALSQQYGMTIRLGASVHQNTPFAVHNSSGHLNRILKHLFERIFSSKERFNEHGEVVTFYDVFQWHYILTDDELAKHITEYNLQIEEHSHKYGTEFPKFTQETMYMIESRRM